MEFPVEGNYTPNFTESECSIRIPGIAWNEESPRSFRETPRITSPNKDSRDGRVQAFSAQRTSDTPRPTEELPSIESIIERVCSQICNDLRMSGVLKDEIVAARVYSELSSRCIRRGTDPDGSTPASGRSSAINGSRAGQNNGGKSSNGDRASTVSKTSSKRSVVKPANSLSTRREESRNSSKNNRVRSSASNESRIEQNNGCSPTDDDRDSVVSTATTERSAVKSAKSLKKRNEKSSQENRNSSKSSHVSSRAGSARPDIGSTSRSSSLVSRDLTRSGTPARGQRGSSANSVSSRGRVLESSMNKDRQTPSPSIKQIYSSSIQSTQYTPRSTGSKSSENVQYRRKSIQSGSKQDTEIVPLDQPKLQNNESSTSVGKEYASSRSNASHIPVRTRTPRVKDFAQITCNEDKIRQDSPPIVYSVTNSPSGIFGGKVHSKSVDTEILVKDDKRKMDFSSQVSFTMSSVGGVASSSNEGANNEKRIDETKDKSPKLASEKSSTSQTSMGVSSGRSSKIPIRSVTPKGTETANAKAKDNAKRMSKEKLEDSNTSVIESVKNVSSRENKTSDAIVNKMKKKASVPKAGHKKEENTQMNALERRKAYEEKRKLERKGALTAKSAKKTKIASEKQINNTGDKDELQNKARKDPIVSTEVPITKKKLCHNEDSFTYEDDFEPIEEEKRNVHHESAVDTGIVDRALAKSPESKIEMKSVNYDIKHETSVRDDHTEGKPDNTPRLNFMTDKEIHDWQVDTVHGRFAADGGRAYPSSTLSDVDFGYLGPPTSNDLVQSQSGYHPGYCLTHMHPSIAHVYDNLDQIPEYKRMKEKTKRKAGKRSSYADENEHVRRKPSNAKKKTTVGYVPGYGAVRVMKEDVGQAYPGGRKRTSSNTSFPVIENQPKPGQTQRPVVGYVPGYGPVRGPPIQVFPVVPSERVVLPPLDFGQACSCNGDVKRSKKGRDKKRSEDLLENRAQAKPFNTYVDEEASRRFERQYARHR
ncbi:uncharacterized protein LOC128177861 [Crassostrea angulata]|uniref:uncharacterized protein LOC128177861 n=1 Tax=Magallana angulata TaxID=2784310 RepID=UPI0022B0E67D|nr:uncharacterized protein LOC128177861 [Crassostrea angulata]